jgi:hypothetical protein
MKSPIHTLSSEKLIKKNKAIGGTKFFLKERDNCKYSASNNQIYSSGVDYSIYGFNLQAHPWSHKNLIHFYL